MLALAVLSVHDDVRTVEARILDGGQIWWDVRPHHKFTTLEYRICDIPLRAEETITIAALFQAITAKLWLLRSRNLTYRPYRRTLIMENKWRAARWGVRLDAVPSGAEWSGTK